MKIEEFNNHMSGLNLDNGMPKEISLLALIEALLDGKPQKRKNRHLIVPPWLYDVEDSAILLHLGQDLRIPLAPDNEDNNFLPNLKEQKPYIAIKETTKIWNWKPRF